MTAVGVEAGLPHDLSPWGMFLAADIVVQAVMVGLVVASVLVWAVVIVKGAEIALARLRTARALAALAGAGSLAQAQRALGERRGLPAAMLADAIAERGESAGLNGAGVRERIAIRLSRHEKAAARRLSRGTGLLATTAAAAPFVGLFGTVWGIMNAFVGIAAAQTTNLAIVAPGIAEALLATGIGLAAAIPAAVFYNLLARANAAHRGSLGDYAAIVARLASRDLDRDAAARRAESPAPRRAHAAE